MEQISIDSLSDRSMDLVSRIRDRYSSEGVSGIVSSSYRVLERRALQFYYNRTHTAKTDSSPYKLLLVDPHDIQYVSGVGLERRDTGRHLEYVQWPWYLRFAEYGDVIGGDWDVPRVKFTELSEWALINERFGKGIPWKETSVYEDLVARIEHGNNVYGCSTVEELHERFEYLSTLKESMASDGYRRTDTESSSGVGVGRDSAASLDEITVNIGRGGELLHHTNGRHRLALAKVLNIPKVPVLVMVRHEGWQRKRDRVRTGSETDHSHPDLADIRRSAEGTVSEAPNRK